MSLNLLKVIAKSGQIFTLKDLANKTQIKKEILMTIASRLENKGYIERIEKGKYLIIPLNSEKGKYTLHEFIIGSFLTKPYAIGYWSALHYYGLTEQIPRTIFIQTTTRKKKNFINIFGLDYRIIRIKNEKFFGLRKEWIEETQINITDKEKTIVDCLDKPQYSGGIAEIAKALRHDNLNLQNIHNYALKIGNSVVVRRLGYICEKHGINIDLPKPNTRTYHYLDPTMPKKGINDPKWRLIINYNLKSVEE